MSVLFYRRPDYVNRPAGPLNQADCQKYVERTKNNKNAIPAELSFQKVIDNEALPVSLIQFQTRRYTLTILQPCSLEDFMDYLVYVAHDAETLQFYLWLQDYTKRYNALRKEEQALSPAWTQTFEGRERQERQAKARRQSVVSLDNLGELDNEKPPMPTMRMSKIMPGVKDIFADPPMSPTAANDYESFISKSVNSSKTVAELTDDANAQVGLKWQACMFTSSDYWNATLTIIQFPYSHFEKRSQKSSHTTSHQMLPVSST